MRHRLGLVVLGALFWAAPVHADPIGEGVKDLPIFDAHVHYKEPAWGPYPPGTVIELMDRAGVAMALVSSTPDEGTIKLYEYAPNRIVPEVRPYHGGYGSSNWTSFDGMFDYIRGRMDAYPHVGIGEFHLHDIAKADEGLLRQIATLAAERGALLHIHSGAEPVSFMYGIDPNLTIIWAHAGMSEPPAVVGPMMDKHPTLYADLSYREWEILKGEGGTLDPAWKALLEKHADRFMVGTDTWVNEQWAQYSDLVAMNRAWLAQFPKDLAEGFAYRNAERLFKRKVSRDLIGTR
ncbi:MAG: amidohydrolase family protein [Rhodospirillales bacterium]|nr:amidohydrolase family protein [Rhodospirillales bacterium]MBO6785294.1 amidohydrolase family protein [Rhodospirillales bacterium]